MILNMGSAFTKLKKNRDCSTHSYRRAPIGDDDMPRGTYNGNESVNISDGDSHNENFSNKSRE